MPEQHVKCAICGTERDIRRKQNTAPDYSFWCEKCRKEVPQAEPPTPNKVGLVDKPGEKLCDRWKWCQHDFCKTHDKLQHCTECWHENAQYDTSRSYCTDSDCKCHIPEERQDKIEKKCCPKCISTETDWEGRHLIPCSCHPSPQDTIHVIKGNERDCVCGLPKAIGVIHRQDGPCYVEGFTPSPTSKGTIKGCPHHDKFAAEKDCDCSHCPITPSKPSTENNWDDKKPYHYHLYSEFSEHIDSVEIKFRCYKYHGVLTKKKCTHCEIERPITDFWKNPRHKAGISNCCRFCFRIIDKERYYKNHLKSKRYKLATSKRMMEKYPEKWTARSLTKYAVKIGKLIKMPCEVCGEVKVQAHHKDYSKPLEVNWVCIGHHRELYHRKIY